MTPPKVFLVNGQLYLEEGAEIAKLLLLEDVARRQRTHDWTWFLVGVAVGTAAAVARFVLL